MLRDVSLPLARPALVASGSLVFMVTASAFGAPALIGNAARLDFLSTSIFDSLSSGLGGMAHASSLACLLLALALVPMLLRARHHAVVTGKASRPTLVRLGRARVLMFLGVGLFVRRAGGGPSGLCAHAERPARSADRMRDAVAGG